MMKKKKLNMMTLSLIPIAIGINFVGSQIAIMLKLPLYLDTIGTILVGALCGPIPGLLTGVFTICINGIFDPIQFAYILNCSCYGFVAGLLAKRKWFRSPLKTLFAGITIATIGDILSTPVTALLYGGISETGQSVLIIAFRSLGLGVIPATLVSGLIMEMLDKSIAAFVAFSIIKAISDRFLSRFPLGPIYYRKNREGDAKTSAIGISPDRPEASLARGLRIGNGSPAVPGSRQLICMLFIGKKSRYIYEETAI